MTHHLSVSNSFPNQIGVVDNIEMRQGGSLGKACCALARIIVKKQNKNK